MKIATLKDKQLVVDILVSAFAALDEDNSINLIVKQDEKRIQRMRLLMEHLFKDAIRTGEVYLSDNEKACLLLKFSNKHKISLHTFISELKLVFHCIGVKNALSVLKRQRIVKRHYPKQPYIRPVIAGVKNEVDGKGSAARLMIEVIKHYKGNTLPVIVDAASEKNVKMYEKFGFRIFNIDQSLGFPIYFLRLN